jgi:hypothetical protein
LGETIGDAVGLEKAICGAADIKVIQGGVIIDIDEGSVDVEHKGAIYGVEGVQAVIGGRFEPKVCADGESFKVF